MHENERDLPKPAIPLRCVELVESTPKRPLVVTGKTAGRPGDAFV